MDHGPEVAEPLAQRQSFHGQGIVVGHDAEVAFAPANALRTESRYIRRGLPGHEALADGLGLPALGVDAHAGVHVLGNRFRRNVANFLESLASEHGGAAGEDGAIPQVPTWLDYFIEQVAFLPVAPVLVVEAGLEVVEVIKGVRRL